MANGDIKTVADFRKAIAHGPYAWPGGYPIYFITSDGAALSFKTAKKEKRNIISAIGDRRNDGWRVVAADINWEDNELYDEHTGEKIEAAYGDE